MRDVDISRLETVLGRLLLAGVLSSAVCLAAGLIVSFTHASPSTANRLLTAGLMILMGTPVLRVVVSIVEYVPHARLVLRRDDADSVDRAVRDAWRGVP